MAAPTLPGLILPFQMQVFWSSEKKQPFLHAHCPCRRAILILGGGWGSTTNLEKKLSGCFFSQTPEWGFHLKSDSCCKSLGEGGEAQQISKKNQRLFFSKWGRVTKHNCSRKENQRLFFSPVHVVLCSQAHQPNTRVFRLTAAQVLKNCTLYQCTLSARSLHAQCTLSARSTKTHISSFTRVFKEIHNVFIYSRSLKNVHFVERALSVQ